MEVRGAQVELDATLGDLELRRRQPVGPRVQERECSRLPRFDVRREIDWMGQEVVAAVVE